MTKYVCMHHAVLILQLNIRIKSNAVIKTKQQTDKQKKSQNSPR